MGAPANEVGGRTGPAVAAQAGAQTGAQAGTASGDGLASEADVTLDRDKVAEYAELYKRLGGYPYDQDPLRPGWTPTVPNNRWADPLDDRKPEIAY